MVLKAVGVLLWLVMSVPAAAETRPFCSDLKVSRHELAAARNAGSCIDAEPKPAESAAAEPTQPSAASKARKPRPPPEPSKPPPLPPPPPPLPKYVMVPDYIGWSVEEASESVARSGLRANVKFQRTSIRRGQIVGQAPRPTRVLRGSVVTFAVSDGSVGPYDEIIKQALIAAGIGALLLLVAAGVWLVRRWLKSPAKAAIPKPIATVEFAGPTGQAQATSHSGEPIGIGLEVSSLYLWAQPSAQLSPEVSHG